MMVGGTPSLPAAPQVIKNVCVPIYLSLLCIFLMCCSLASRAGRLAPSFVVVVVQLHIKSRHHPIPPKRHIRLSIRLENRRHFRPVPPEPSAEQSREVPIKPTSP